MSLEDLNNQLYTRDHADDRKLPETPFDIHPETPEQEPTAAKAESFELVGTEKLTFKEKILSFWRRHTVALSVSVGIGVLLIGAVIGFFVWRSQFFSEDDITIELSGPDAIASGTDTTLSYHIVNHNRARLENAQLRLEYSTEFKPVTSDGWQPSGGKLVRSLGGVANEGEISGSISGKFFGNKDAISRVQLILEYSPQNISGTYERSTEVAVRIDASPLVLETQAPRQLVTGQQIDYQLTYRNESEIPYDNLRIVAEFPEGFVFQNAEPKSTTRDEWALGTFQSEQSGKIVISGTLSGQWNEFKTARFKIGYYDGAGQFVSYNEGSTETQIIASPLSVKQVVNDQTEYTARLGETLRYTVEYANNGDVGLRDVVITMLFEDPYVDWGALSLTKGTADEATRTITWKTSDIKELRSLAPGARGEIDLSIPVLSELPDKSSEPVISTLVRADSPDVPAIITQNKVISSNTLTVKLSAGANMTVAGWYHDDKIPGSGPMPPEVNQETKFTIRATVQNPGNDLSQAKVVFTLPGSMRYTGVTDPSGESVKYNDRTDEVTWDMGTLVSGKSKTLRFQLSFTPSSSQAGEYYELVKQAVLTAQDSFANQSVEIQVTTGNINFRSDTNLPSDSSRVKE